MHRFLGLVFFKWIDQVLAAEEGSFTLLGLTRLLHFQSLCESGFILRRDGIAFSSACALQ
jgi:hypothetical protein